MKKLYLFLAIFIIANNLIMAKNKQQNPFFCEYQTPHQSVPFNTIKTEHYKPAFLEGIEQQKKEIQNILNNTEQPTFENTIVALENSGELLNKVSSVFFNLLSAETNEEMESLSLEMSPILTEHANSISLNEDLFARIKSVQEKNEKLNSEQQMLLKKTYDGFIKNGANLNEKDKEEYKKISAELSKLTLQFGQNVLKETNSYQLIIVDKDSLNGLPEDFLEASKLLAKQKGKNGYLFNLTAPSYVPFLKYAENRDIRKELYMAYNTKCVKGGEYDNREIIRKITQYRLQTAKLMGFENYAEYVLQNRMAENSNNVYKLLNELLEAYKPTALNEYKEIQKYAEKNGANFELMPWDFSFYSEKLKHEKYNINDELLKPYFELEKVKKGVFGLATKLFGLEFKENKKIPTYNHEVEAYEVFDKTGKFMAILYTDFHARESKRGGAWMTEYKGQKIENGKDSRPHISIVMNFTRPTKTKPALLTYDELTTLLHEFGHALHGILSEVTYESLSGTNVYRDFVELPSQLLENWASEDEFLNEFAMHYKTKEKIPFEFVQKIKEAENFNVAYFCLRQLSFGYLDMAWHTLKEPYSEDIISFEIKAWEHTQVLPKAENVCMSTSFNHIFSGGYAAGYYSYKWAEVLDADAFSVFKKNGIFDKKTAQSFKENILSKGGTEHPMILYKKFRGQEPTIDGLLQRTGIK